MKFRKDRGILRFFGMSSGMILLGVIISLFIQPIFFIGAGLILGGLVLSVTGLYASTKPIEYFIPDERITKNTDKAGHHAFWLVLLVITFFNMVELYSPSSIKYMDGSTVIMLVGVYSFLILRWYYNKKGEAE
ncbi:MAG: hypothetical protein OIN89_09650 [Candidatus Methanoperedens sp.]|jgi:hypothetical protein|nr:hypothetical protein [Candidatus Methanoperedens sp.]PKL53062.1 MAG: hypothetical protein CVV36_09115 [Candidatus Methanoperedenaceae archaeon HGW-Methanoperedenaceae-1]